MTTRVLAAETTNFLLPNATIFVEFALFLIVLFVLYRYVVPPLSRALDERQDMVRKQVQDKELAARTLQEARERYESELADARAEAASIRDEARADAARVRTDLREQADREVERIRQRGEEQLVAARDQTVRQVRAEIGGLLMQLAERIIVESLSDDERKAATVDHFLDELDQMVNPGTDRDHEREFAPAGAGDEARA